MVSCDNNYPCIEKDYVRDTYNAIAEHFSATRGYHWECVKDFLRDVPPNSTVFEVGCGNGKNFLCTDRSKNIVFSGCDVSEEMVDLARKRVYEKTINDSAVTATSPPHIFQADICEGLSDKIETNTFDYTMCVAVIHHLSTFARRLKAIKELVRITKSGGGKILLTSWCSSHTSKSEDIFKKWELQPRYINNNNNNNNNNTAKKMYKRYYHLFCEDEMKDLLNMVDGINWVMYCECNNWIAILTKKNSSIIV